MPDAEIEAAVRNLIRAGSTYDLDALDPCYAPDLEIVMVAPDGQAMVFDRAANMAFFRDRRDGGAPPLSQDVRFIHTAATGDIGCAVVERRMALTGPEVQTIVFTLMLRRDGGGWTVFRETAVVR